MGQPLSVKTISMLFPGQAIAIVIYWEKRKGNDNFQNGHASLVLDVHEVVKNPRLTSHYASWMGSSDGINPLKRRAEQNSIVDDSREWGTFPSGSQYCQPTRWVAIRNLKLSAMRTEWNLMCTKQSAHWKVVDKNCATTVANLLKAGGGDALATAAKHQLVWWPTDLIRYARSMGTNIAAQS